MVSFVGFMKDVSSSNFGLVIAHLVPGAVALAGFRPFSATVQSWFATEPLDAPTVGGFMYVTLASIAAGVTLNTVRWAVLDTIHSWTGLPQPAWNFSRLRDNVAAYTVLNEIHYKYYQFHGNLLVALLVVYVARRIHLGALTAPLGWLDLGFLLLSVILFVGSRDTLRKYYARVSQFLGTGKPVHRTRPAARGRRTRPAS